MKKRRIYIILAFIVIASLAFITMFNLFGSKPDNLGVQDGRLAPCPSSPNCVSTQAKDEEHGMQPILFSGSAESAMQEIKSALRKMPRIEVVSERENYLHAEATSLIFRFVDDVEFLVDEEAGLIHFRSASRVGHSDLGANRARMERFRQLFESDNP